MARKSSKENKPVQFTKKVTVEVEEVPREDSGQQPTARVLFITDDYTVQVMGKILLPRK